MSNSDKTSEVDRMDSFFNAEWTIGIQSRTTLSRDGLYHTGAVTLVGCNYCNLTIGLTRRDIPYEDHRILSPGCPFVRGEIPGVGGIGPYYDDDSE